MKTLLLIDGEHLLYRNIHRFKTFTHNGNMTGGLYGFVNSLNSLLQKRVPDEVIVCWRDRRENLWRREIYPEYKMSRSSQDVNFPQQLGWVTDLLGACGIKQLKVATQEGDDVLAHIALKNKDVFDEIIISSGDKDLRQLIDDEAGIKVLAEGAGKSILYNERKFKDEYGFPPKDLPTYLSLVGDKSDGVPGVLGIGTMLAKKIMFKRYNIRQQTKKKYKDAQEDGTLDLMFKLVNLRDTNIPNIVNMMPEYDRSRDKAYKILLEAGCQNSLMGKTIYIANYNK